MGFEFTKHKTPVLAETLCLKQGILLSIYRTQRQLRHSEHAGTRKEEKHGVAN